MRHTAFRRLLTAAVCGGQQAAERSVSHASAVPA